MQGRRARSSTSPAAPLIVDEDLQAALDSGKVGGAALDVFRSRADHRAPAVRLPQRRRHAAPRRLDRRGDRPRRLPGRRAGRRRADRRQRHHAPSTCRRSPPRTSRCSGRSCRSCRQLGRLATALAERLDRPRRGRVPRPHRRARHAARWRSPCCSASLSGHTEEDVNAVNAPVDRRGARHRRASRRRAPAARDFTDLVRVTVVGGDQRERVVGTTLGRRHRPHLLEAWGQRFNLQLEDHLALFRYRDVPGMIGRVGTVFGAARRSTSTPPRSATSPTTATRAATTARR